MLFLSLEEIKPAYVTKHNIAIEEAKSTIA